VNSLIPTSFTSISRDLDLPPIPLQSPAQVIERNEKAGEVGLFSAFTSYVSSVMNDEPPEPNDQEIESTLMTVDCITDCRFEEILGNVSELPVESLKSLTYALLNTFPEDESPRVISVKTEAPSTQQTRSPAGKATADAPVYEPSLVYVLELATILALRDEETISTLGADAAEALQVAIRDAEHLHPVALSRAVFYLLSLLRASNDHGYIRAPVVLHAISSFRPELLKQCAQPILKGIYGCISGPPELRNELASSPDFWAVLHVLQPHPDAASLAFEIAESVSSSQLPAITADNYEPAMALLNAFATAGSVGAKFEQQQREQPARKGQQAPAQDKKLAKKPDEVLRATKAIAIVTQLASRVPSLIEQSHLETHEAWKAYWSPIFRCLATQCVNPCREVRYHAFSALQRCLQAPDLASPNHKEWTKIFVEVLFPLINQLLKPEVHQTDPHGMTETRLQATQLLCKTFLHYLSLLSEWDGMLDLWTRILETMDRLMNSGQSNMLVEAVPETLKNVLLVMASAEHLIPPPAAADKEERTEQQQQIWTETWTRTEKFMPGLMPELFPGAGKEPAPAAQPAQAPSNGKAESVSEDGSSSSQDTEESAPAAAAEAKAE
jgi:brefeldin A-resistance guanine nucleotide exchange factor 1